MKTAPQTQLRVPAQGRFLPLVQGHVRDLARTAGLPDRDVLALELAAEEAFENICTHAYPDGTPGDVLVDGVLLAGELRLAFHDEGLPFDPALLERRGFHDIKISLKSSSVLHTIEAYQLLSGRVDYPLHIGVTEAGTLLPGAVKSAVGLGVLLFNGIGDTLRVSLTHDPVAEIGVAYDILRALGLRERGPEVISCPTCGRTEIGLIKLAEEVQKRLRDVPEVFKVAVMGCVVNGPGEAREADIGIAGGRGSGIVFRKGTVVRKIRGEANLLPEFMKELDIFLKEKRKE